MQVVFLCSKGVRNSKEKKLIIETGRAITKREKNMSLKMSLENQMPKEEQEQKTEVWELVNAIQDYSRGKVRKKSN